MLHEFMKLAIVVMNIVAFFMYGIDKFLAKKQMYRISESNLLLSGFLFGSVGSLVGMQMFRHKTKKMQFWGLNIACLVSQMYIIYLVATSI